MISGQVQSSERIVWEDDIFDVINVGSSFMKLASYRSALDCSVLTPSKVLQDEHIQDMGTNMKQPRSDVRSFHLGILIGNLLCRNLSGCACGLVYDNANGALQSLVSGYRKFKWSYRCCRDLHMMYALPQHPVSSSSCAKLPAMLWFVG